MNILIKPSLDQFNNILNKVNIIPDDNLLSNQFNLKIQCNKFKKYILIDKLKVEIFQINNNYYVSKNFINLLSYDKSCFMELYRYINKYLFALPNRELLKQNKIFLTDSISINYNGFNIELWDINELNQYSNNNFKLNILYKLFKSNNFEEDLIKICGTKNNEEQDYYRFIFKNIQFNFIEYKSDIDKIKEEYDKKIKDLSDKLNLLMNN